jgi:hypothetical protein
MMKRKPKPQPSQEPKPDSREAEKPVAMEEQKSGPSARFGQKTPIDKKEMLALTNKNYDLLPEVQKKRMQD